MIVQNDRLLPEIVRILESGDEVIIRAKGESMRPYIRHMRHGLVLAQARRDALRRGDVVLALTTDGRYVVHRIRSIDGDDIVLKGDGNFRGTERCHRSQVFGELVGVMRGERRVDCRTRAERAKAWVLRHLWHLRLWCGCVFRKVFP